MATESTIDLSTLLFPVPLHPSSVATSPLNLSTPSIPLPSSTTLTTLTTYTEITSSLQLQLTTISILSAALTTSIITLLFLLNLTPSRKRSCLLYRLILAACVTEILKNGTGFLVFFGRRFGGVGFDSVGAGGDRDVGWTAGYILLTGDVSPLLGQAGLDGWARVVLLLHHLLVPLGLILVTAALFVQGSAVLIGVRLRLRAGDVVYHGLRFALLAVSVLGCAWEVAYMGWQAYQICGVEHGWVGVVFGIYEVRAIDWRDWLNWGRLVGTRVLCVGLALWCLVFVCVGLGEVFGGGRRVLGQGGGRVEKVLRSVMYVGMQGMMMPLVLCALSLSSKFTVLGVGVQVLILPCILLVLPLRSFVVQEPEEGRDLG